MAYDPAVARQWTARLQADPGYQAALAKDRADPKQLGQNSAIYVGKLGLPKEYAVTGPDGTIGEQTGDFPKWSKYAMLAIGGVAAAPYIAGAIGGGAAAGGATGTGAVAGGGIGGGVAAGVGAAAAHSAPSWLGPVIGAGGSIAGSAISARASDRASQRQAELTREALEYEKSRDLYGNTTEANRYAAMMNAQQPYIDTGRASDERMAELMGLPAPSPSRTLAPPPTYVNPGMPGMNQLPTSPNDPRLKIPGFDPRTGIVTPSPQGPPASSAPSAGSPPVLDGNGPPPAASMVKMVAPDGSVQEVPADQEQHYRSKGAMRI